MVFCNTLGFFCCCWFCLVGWVCVCVCVCVWVGVFIYIFFFICKLTLISLSEYDFVMKNSEMVLGNFFVFVFVLTACLIEFAKFFSCFHVS